MSLFDNGYLQKFIVAPEYLTDHELLIVLTDIAFWNIYYDDLQVWCRDHNSKREGMVVVVPDKPTLTAFCLRWS